jgi:hypothetical protein
MPGLEHQRGCARRWSEPRISAVGGGSWCPPAERGQRTASRYPGPGVYLHGLTMDILMPEEVECGEDLDRRE